MKTAILVDGGFYRRRAQIAFGDISAQNRAIESQEGTFPDACIATNFSLNENGDIM